MPARRITHKVTSHLSGGLYKEWNFGSYQAASKKYQELIQKPGYSNMYVKNTGSNDWTGIHSRRIVGEGDEV